MLNTKEPFILVIGTSHSCGVCDDEYIKSWVDLLKEKSKYPVVNISRPGNYNTFMIEQLNDLFQTGHMKNCKLVIAEPRLGEGQRLVPFQKEWTTKGNYPWERNMLYEIRHMEMSMDITENGSSDFRFNEPLPGVMFTQFNAKGVADKGRIKQHIKNHFLDCEKNDPPEQALDDFKDYIWRRWQFYGSTDLPYYEDLSNIRTMKTMVTAAGAEFKWFPWSVKTCNTLELDKWLNNKWDIFDNLIGPLKPHFTDKYRDESLLCDCKHHNEKGHKLIWDDIYSKLKDII